MQTLFFEVEHCMIRTGAGVSYLLTNSVCNARSKDLNNTFLLNKHWPQVYGALTVFSQT